MFERLVVWFDSKKKISAWITVLAGAIGLMSAFYGISRSDLFIVNVVEFTGEIDSPPLSEEEILKLARVPLNTVNLLSLNLDPVRERIMEHPWVEKVQLTKRFPQTLQIRVDYREPVAVAQIKNGELYLIDARGVAFEKATVRFLARLPMLYGIPAEHYLKAVELIRSWNERSSGATVSLSQIEWNEETGFRVVAKISSKDGPTQRCLLDLGTQPQLPELNEQLDRVLKIADYLRDRKLTMRQIHADLGKKVVVKINPRS